MSLQIEFMPLEKLTLYQRNPRRISRLELNRLQRSMKHDPGFFTARPCLVNKIDGQFLVYAGNQRVKAAKKLGWKKIPCFIEENLSDKIMQERLIKDNRHNGEWDYDMLASDYEIKDLLELGFSKSELEIGDTAEELEKAEQQYRAEKREEEKKGVMCPNCGHVF